MQRHRSQGVRAEPATPARERVAHGQGEPLEFLGILKDLQEGVSSIEGLVSALRETFIRRSNQSGELPDNLIVHSSESESESNHSDFKRSGDVNISISVRLLGSFAVTVNDRPITEWNGVKAKALFKYLILHRERGVSRDQLMEALWPDGDPAASANSLRVTVHSLRKTLSTGVTPLGRDAFISYEDNSYTFRHAAGLTVDVDEFERHWSAGRQLEQAGAPDAARREFEAAERAYGGDLLEEDPYEDWLLLRREALQDIYLTVLGRLSDGCLEREDWEGCILRCQRILACDPCREDIYRRLILSHVRLGQPSRARRWFEVCARVLRRELDLSPAEETVALYRRLLGGRTSLNSPVIRD